MRFQACFQHADDFLQVDPALETPGYGQAIPPAPVSLTAIRERTRPKIGGKGITSAAAFQDRPGFAFSHRLFSAPGVKWRERTFLIRMLRRERFQNVSQNIRLIRNPLQMRILVAIVICNRVRFEKLSVFHQ